MLVNYDFKQHGGVKEESRLILVSSSANSNKHWTAYLCNDDTIIVHNGRVGDAGQVRPVSARGSQGLQKLIKSKTAKGYSEQLVISGDAPATPGSSIGKSALADKVRKDIARSSNPTLDRMIDLLIKSNIHNIVGSTSISYNEQSGLFSTPLGIITPDAVSKARVLLDEIANMLRKGKIDPDTADKYLRIVPQRVGHRLVVEDIFGTQAKLDKHSDNLDALEASIKAMAVKKLDDDDEEEEKEEALFKVNLDLETDPKELDWINKFYDKTKNVRSSTTGMRIENIFKLELVEGRIAFEKKGRQIGNVQRLWHGTSTANLLSILQSGLRKSPPSTARIAGKAFGNGVYFSDIATKSLGYATGYWGGSGSRNQAFMLLNEVAMGTSYNPDRTDPYGSWPKNGTNSTFAKGGNVFMNNEMIVYQDYQVNTTHLVEFTQ